MEGPGRAHGTRHNERLAEYGWKLHSALLAQKSLSWASMHWYMHEQQGYGFIEFEISSSTNSTVFRQPLTQGTLHSAARRGAARHGVDSGLRLAACGFRRSLTLSSLCSMHVLLFGPLITATRSRDEPKPHVIGSPADTPGQLGCRQMGSTLMGPLQK